MERIVIGDFQHGYNSHDEPHGILETQASAIQNIDLSARGVSKTRGGTAYLNSTEIASGAGIFGAGYLKSKHWAAALTGVYALATGTYTAFKTGLTANSEVFGTEFESYGFFANGVDAPFTYDGSSSAAMSGTPSYWTTYKPNMFLKHENRLWGLTCSTSQLDWCDVETPTDWTTKDKAGTHQFNKNDGYTGIGIASQKSGLIYFKQKSIHKVTGKTPVSFSFPTLYDTIGCVAARTIVNYNNRIFFLSEHEGYYKVIILGDDGSITETNEDIQPTLSLINTTTANKSAAVIYKDKYRLSYPLSAGGWGVVNLNFKTGRWEVDSGNAGKCYYVQGASCYAGGTGDGYVRQIETGTSDAGSVAITSYVRSKRYQLLAPELHKELKYMIVWTKASGSYNLNVNIRVDGKLVPGTYAVPLGTKGTTETMRRATIPINAKVRGGLIDVQFGTSTVDQPFELYKAILYYEMPKGFIKD